MQFFVLLRRKTESFPESAFAPLLDAEAEAARKLHTEFKVRQIWGRTDVSGAAMMVEADSTEQVHEILAGLPLVKNRMLEVQVVGLTAYRGFAPRNP